jgi:hypothetical protein
MQMFRISCSSNGRRLEWVRNITTSRVGCPLVGVGGGIATVIGRDEFGNALPYPSAYTVTFANCATPGAEIRYGNQTGQTAPPNSDGSFMLKSDITKQGTGYKLKVTVGTLTLESAAFDVVAGPATPLPRWAPNQGPRTLAVGAKMQPEVVVHYADLEGTPDVTKTGTCKLIIYNRISTVAQDIKFVDLVSGQHVSFITAPIVRGVAKFSSIYLDAVVSDYSLTVQEDPPAPGGLTTYVGGGPHFTTVLPGYKIVAQSSELAGRAFTICTVTAIDSAGATVEACSTPITLRLIKADGTPTTGVTFNVANPQNPTRGVADFRGIWIDKVGTYKLQAYSGETLVATSEVITISPNVTTKLAYVAVPGTSLTAGGKIGGANGVQVKATDNWGNVTTAHAGNATLTAASDAILGTRTAAFANGIATFGDLSIKKTGSYPMTIGANGTNTLALTVTVVAGPVSKLVFAPISTLQKILASVALPEVKVTAVDQFGNTATNFTGNITITLNDTGGTGATLGGTQTLPVKDGVATFTTLTVDKPGTYTLSASLAPKAPLGTSAPFTVLKF